MTSKRRLFLLLVSAALGVLLLAVLIINQPSPEERAAEQMILAFIQAEGLDIRPNTPAYDRLMKGILLGEYPRLTGPGSPYSPAERDVVINYAARHMKVKYPAQIGTPIPEAASPGK